LKDFLTGFYCNLDNHSTGNLKSHSLDSQSLIGDSNSGPPKYKAEVLITTATSCPENTISVNIQIQRASMVYGKRLTDLTNMVEPTHGMASTVLSLFMSNCM
jgi:hypothetical protein